MTKSILFATLAVLILTSCTLGAGFSGQVATHVAAAPAQSLVAGSVQESTQQPTNNIFPPTEVLETPQTFPQHSTASTSTVDSPGITSTATSIEPSLPRLVTVPALPGNIPYPIQFDVNGTYQDLIVDRIPAGKSRMFSVKAMKGQIMSIATWRQAGMDNYIPQIQIKGADGTVLCPKDNSQCMFWRGILPASQDYYLTFAADANWDAAGFIMRVAINPPGVDQYRNESTGVLLTYNDAFAPTGGLFDSYISTGNYIIQPDLILHLIDTKAFEKTNLSAVYMTIGSTREAQSVQSCLDLDSIRPSEQAAGTETINGYEFAHTKRKGVAAGNFGEQEIYRMVYGNTCYEIIYHIHSVNIGNYLPGSVVEFDRSTIIKELSDIFSSFRIN
ncbi:MAG: hypothetical protein P8Y14_23730 [Anaerolineales bacterium]